MKKYLIGALVLIAVIVMVKTVPDKKVHKKAMMEAVKEYVDEEAANLGLGDDVLSNLGKGIVNKTVEVALNSKLEVDNYLLFNMTHVELDGENKILSLGILGHVFTFDKEMLREKLEEATKVKEEAVSEKEAAKQSAKELKQLQKEQKKREKELEKEKKRQEKEAKKEQKRREKELKKEQKRKEKEAKRQEKEKTKAA